MSEIRRPPLASRRSYFLEGPMEEYTPANSIIDGQASRGGGAATREVNHLEYWTDGRGRLIVRIVNAVVHLILCCILLAMMGEFLARHNGHSRRPQAIILTTLVVVDCCIDVYSVARARNKWQGWALILRLFLSMAYIAQFFAYVGFHQVFPRKYSFWGMDASYSEPIVYLWLWLLGIWNLLHTAIHRHTVGRDLKRYKVSLLSLKLRGDRSGSRFDRDGIASRFRRQRRQPTSQIQTGRDLETGLPIALSQVAGGDKRPHVLVKTRSFADSTFGGSASQAGTLGRTDSNTLSAVESSRASIAESEATLEVGEQVHDFATVRNKH